MTKFLMLQVLFHNAAICKLTPRKSVPALYGTQKQFLLVDAYEVSVFKNYYGVLSLIESRSTVRPLLSTPLLSAELDYPRFLRTNLSTPNFYEIQSDLYDLHLYYPRFLRPKFSTPKYRG